MSLENEIETLKHEILERVEKLAQLTNETICPQEAKQSSWITETRAKLSFLDLVLRGHPKPSISDYREEF